MEDTLSMILHGCRLARDLDSNLQHLSTQPMLLYNSCEELVRVFQTAKDRLNLAASSSSFPHQLNIHHPSSSKVPPPPPPLPRVSELDAAVQEWLWSSQKQSTMDLLQAPNLVTPELKVFELGGMNVEYNESVEADFSPPGGSELGKSPPTQRLRKRKDGADKSTVRLPAPHIGNTEIPPDDGFTWRKYGQKEILGSTYPRGYYRCTHKNFYGCQAKKQVQRLDDDPNIFEVTYYGHHTCHTSQTAPSALPQIAEMVVQDMLENPHVQSSLSSSIPIPLSAWLTMDTEAMSTRATAGSSHISRNTKELECPVVHLADAMFNSTSSSNNSMDCIFPFSMQDK